MLAPLCRRDGRDFAVRGFTELPLSQTAVGWLLRELSKREPDVVKRFVAEHEAELSHDARRMAMAKIEGRGRR